MALVTVQRSPTPSEADLLDERIDLDGDAPESSSPRPGSFRSLSEFYFTVKGAAVVLSHSDHSLVPHSSHGTEIEEHLQAMLHLVRPQDTLSMAVRLQASDRHLRYLAVVTSATRDVLLLGVDFSESLDTSIGLVVPLWSSTRIQVDGDGGIRVDSEAVLHLFKPVSVQAMWSVFQCLHKELDRIRNLKISSNNWIHYYRTHKPSKDQFCSMWHYSILDAGEATDLRADLSVGLEALPSSPPPGGLCTEKLIRHHLRQIMQSADLDDVTSKDIRQRLEEVPALRGQLAEHKQLIDREVLVILGQLDRPSQIFPYLYLGTEWNASNWEELKSNNVGYIVNVTKEVDNFFPAHFQYMKIWVTDEESTELLRHWYRTYDFIKEAKEQQKAVLVHCKKGISRSSSTVIAYAMKEYGWSLQEALAFVKRKRGIITPNKGFMEQLATFNGMLEASSNRHSAVFRADEAPEPPATVRSPRDGFRLAEGHVRQQREDYERRCNQSVPHTLAKSVPIPLGTDDCMTDSSSDGESTVRSLVNIFEERAPKEGGGVIFRVNSWNLGGSSSSCAVSP